MRRLLSKKGNKAMPSVLKHATRATRTLMKILGADFNLNKRAQYWMCCLLQAKHRNLIGMWRQASLERVKTLGPPKEIHTRVAAANRESPCHHRGGAISQKSGPHSSQVHWKMITVIIIPPHKCIKWEYLEHTVEFCLKVLMQFRAQSVGLVLGFASFCMLPDNLNKSWFLKTCFRLLRLDPTIAKADFPTFLFHSSLLIAEKAAREGDSKKVK